MSAKKVLSPTTLFRPIPSMVMNSLLHSQDRVRRSNPPSPMKGPSILATSLLKSYAERGLIEDARKVFDEMPERDVVAWTAMIAGYASCNEHAEAWRVFCGMLRSEVDPNVFTLSSVLKACKGMRALWSGAMVHALAIKRCLMSSVYVDNALMDVYATCCVNMDAARMVFEDIDVKSVVSWTTLITGYTHRGDGLGGLHLFRQMLLEGSVAAKAKSTKATREKFPAGALVEVSSDEDGFQGAWFDATVVKALKKNKFLIEYKSLRNDDDTEFLREEVDSLHIRPHPPETPVVDQFKLLDEVDASYNDGWWIGAISKVLPDSRYIVYFKNTKEEIEFEHSELRLHQEWIRGKWVVTSKALKL